MIIKIVLSLTLFPLICAAFLCIINSNSSLILLYFASVLGVKVYCVSSGSGLSQPLAEFLCSFLFNAYIREREIYIYINKMSEG